MSNKCMCPIKTTVNIHRLIESCPHSAWLVLVTQPICRIMSATRECLDSTRWCSFGTGTVRLFEERFADSWQDDYFSMAFLPAMASGHSSMTYKLEFLKNCRIHYWLAMYSSAWAYWQWAEPKFHFVFCAHHLISAYFLTIESDKRMHLLTRHWYNQK